MADGGAGLQDDELYLPRTVVNKLIKEIVPNIRVSSDARDLLLNCCTEFIHLLASEASDISEKQQKKVISPEHVVEALITLGFQEYVADVKAVHKEYKEQASKHRKRGKSKLDRLGIPEEELLRQQQQLFEEARQQQMETELLEQRTLQLQQQQSAVTSQPPPLTQAPPTTAPPCLVPVQPPSSQQKPVAAPPTQTAAIASRLGLSQAGGVVGGVATDTSIAQGASVAMKLPTGPPLLPQSAAITVASLQATSSLLQQAIAIAQQQQQQLQPASTTTQSSTQQTTPTPLSSAAATLQLPHTFLLQQQQALAVLAAQQAQMGTQLTTQLQSVSPPASTTSAGTSQCSTGEVGSEREAQKTSVSENEKCSEEQLTSTGGGT